MVKPIVAISNSASDPDPIKIPKNNVWTITEEGYSSLWNTAPDVLPTLVEHLMDTTTYGAIPMVTQKVSDTREALSQIIAVNVNNILLFSNGMLASYPAILIPGLTSDKDDRIMIGQSEISWIGSIGFMTALIGCSVSGLITHPVGRSRSIHITSPLLFVSWLIFEFATEVWHLYIALCLCGFTSALIEAPILAYKAEVSQPHLRGMLAATSTLSVILGVLLQFLLGTFFHWRTAALISSAFPFAAFVFLFFIPESPQWLILNNRIDKARRNLAWLRGWTTTDQIEEEFERISKNFIGPLPYQSSSTYQSSKKEPSWVESMLNYTRKSFLWPFALVSFLYFLTNFTGLCTLQTYAVNIFASLEAPVDKYYATIILGVTEVFGSIVSLFFVRYYGKRVMGCTSVLGVGLCNTIIGIYSYIVDIKYLQFEDNIIHLKSNTYAWLPLCILILMAFIGHSGIRVLPWTLLGEIFSHETRAGGCGLGSAVYYLIAFLANKVFISMVSVFQISGTSWIYAGVCAIGFITMYFCLPETEGKELEEIINHFAGISELDNNVRKRVIGHTRSNNEVAFVDETDVDRH